MLLIESFALIPRVPFIRRDAGQQRTHDEVAVATPESLGTGAARRMAPGEDIDEARLLIASEPREYVGPPNGPAGDRECPDARTRQDSVVESAHVVVEPGLGQGIRERLIQRLVSRCLRRKGRMQGATHAP